MTNYNVKLGKEIVDAVREGYTTGEIAGLLGYSTNYVSTMLKELVKDGSLVRIMPGKYALPALNGDGEATGEVIPPKPAHSNGTSRVVERDKRTVQLPDYMRTRSGVTISIERESEELEQVVSFEICIGGQWSKQLLVGDIRVYVGSGMPKWSPYQVMIDHVQSYRVTFKNGQQADYLHNPNDTLILDRLVTT